MSLHFELKPGRNQFLRSAMMALTIFGAAIDAMAQQSTLYSEGFNTPGNGTRYELIRDYYEITQPNNLWTTVPNQLPGENVIVYLEPGDRYLDGTEVPARRATFFADNDLGDQTFGLDLTPEGFALFDAAIQWATATDGTTPLSINFVIDDDSFEEFNNLDVTLVERLRDQGHTVNVSNPDLPPEEGDDLIFLASHDDGSAVGGIAPEFKTTTTPLISGFFHAANPLGFGSERGENTNGTYDLQIVDATHPLAAGFAEGIVQVVDDNAARQRLTRVTRGSIAPDAKIVATLPGSVVEVPDDFTNFEGEGYLRGGHSTWNNAPEAGQPRAWQTLASIDTTVVDAPKLFVDVAAMGDTDGVGPYENELDAPDNFDYIRLLVDDNADGEFEILSEFLAVDDFDDEFFGFLASEEGNILSTEFQTFSFPLPSTSNLDIRIDVFTNAGDERVGIDNIRVIGEGVVLDGDFNSDGVLDATDIDLLTAAINGDDRNFDVDGDGSVTRDDRDAWVVGLRNTWFGDSNLDGEFTSGDFVLVFTTGEYEDGVDGNSTWAEGDWNGDGDFTSGDFVTAFTDGGFEVGPRTASFAVPEPTCLVLTIVSVFLFARRMR